MKNEVYIALGSNLGNRIENLKSSLALMEPEISVKEISPVYETPPWGYTSQPAFLNQVIQGETYLTPAELLVFLKFIELRMGRVSTFLYGPRIIDLDILFYDDLIINTPDLKIPHPRIAERAFVLVPLFDISPEYEHPESGVTVSEMLKELEIDEINKFEIEFDET